MRLGPCDEKKKKLRKKNQGPRCISGPGGANAGGGAGGGAAGGAAAAAGSGGLRPRVGDWLWWLWSKLVVVATLSCPSQPRVASGCGGCDGG